MKSKLEISALEFVLQLVEQEDAVVMLNQENITDSFNILFEYDLVELADGKILLTQKGKEVKSIGLQAYLEKLEQNSEAGKPSPSGQSGKAE